MAYIFKWHPWFVFSVIYMKYSILNFFQIIYMPWSDMYNLVPLEIYTVNKTGFKSYFRLVKVSLQLKIIIKN